MRSRLSFALLVGATLTAQTPEPAATAVDPAVKAKLTQVLQKAAATTDTAFAAKWGPIKKREADDGQQIFVQLMGGSRSDGACEGSWHQDRVHVTFDNDEGDQLLIAGHRTLAKDDDHDWTLRSGRLRDGNRHGFIPDLPLLFEQLVRWDLPIAHRSVGSLNDRPIEIVSLTLTVDQVAEAIWCGALPDGLVTAPIGGFGMMMGGGGGRAPARKPTATVDIAIYFDPATGVVHKLHCRAHAKADDAIAGRVVIRAGGAGAPAADEEEEEEQPEEDTKPAEGPLEYVDGLPKRSRKKMTVNDYTVTLSKHGECKAPELTDAQKKLLGR